MRYGRQPYSEIMGMTAALRRRLMFALASLIEKENVFGGEQ